MKLPLHEWQEDGIRLLGRYIDPELLKKVYIEFQNVLKESQTDKADTDALLEQKKKIEEAASKIREIVLFRKLDSEQIDMKGSITNHELRISSLESEKSKKSKKSEMYSIPDRNTCFSGREKELLLIKKFLSGHECQMLAVSGLGGVGKTSLALEAVWDNQDSLTRGCLLADSRYGKWGYQTKGLFVRSGQKNGSSHFEC